MVTGSLHDSVAESMRLVVGQMKTTFSELMESRIILESGIAGLAAERATEEDLTTLQKTLEMGRDKCNDLESYAELDVQFHLDLARAAHNSAFLIMMHPMLELLKANMLISYLGYTDEFKAVIYHERIFEAVKAGDAELASSIMRQHLLIGESDVQEAIKRQDLPQELWKHI